MSTSNALKKYSIYVSRVCGNSTFSFTKFNKIYILADLCLKINFRNSAFQGKMLSETMDLPVPLF